MKVEQNIGIIFAIVGIAMGLFSNFIGIIFLAFIIPIAAYVGSIFASSKMFKEKKIKWIVMHSIGTFVLVWMITWIFVFNTW